MDLLRNGQGVFAISLEAVWDDLEARVDQTDAKPGAQGGGRRLVSTNPIEPGHLLKSDVTRFAHASERQFARLLDFYAIAWEYEPTSFDIDWDAEGR